MGRTQSTSLMGRPPRASDCPHPGIRRGDVWRFTSGDCHILAARIHKLTGWPIHCGVDRGDPNYHAFILTPDGKALDVRGVMTPAECLRGYRKRAHRPFDWATIRKKWATPRLGSYSYERARVIAPILVDLARD